MDNVEKALIEAVLQHWDLDKDKQVAWPNRNFEPPAKGIWARVSFIPNIPTVASLGQGGRDETEGILQIDYNVSQGIGDKLIKKNAALTRNHFVAGKYFKYNGQEVKITGAGWEAGRIVNNFYRLTVSVNWYAQITRNLITQ